MKARIQVIGVGMLICLASSQSVALAAIFDVAADFSATNNPNGPWSYGWSVDLTSLFVPYTTHVNGYPVANWGDPVNNTGGAPMVAHNGTSSTVMWWNPGQFSLHPGVNGEYSHALWTAPYAGTLDIDAVFTALGGGITDVHVLHNGTSLFDGGVGGGQNASRSSTNISFGMGDTIDFAVGFGNNGYISDTTGLSATISAVPVPAGALLGWLGLGTAGWFLRRRVP